jgi:hypothetical protein
MRFGKRTLAGVAAGALALGALTIASAPAASAKPSIKPKAGTIAATASAVRATGVGAAALNIPSAKLTWSAASAVNVSGGSPYVDLTTAPTGSATMTVRTSANAVDDTVQLNKNGAGIDNTYRIGDDSGVYFNVDTAGLYAGFIANGSDTVTFSFTTAGAPTSLSLTPATQTVLVGGVGTVTVALKDASGNITQPQTVDSVSMATTGDDTIAVTSLGGDFGQALQFGTTDDTIATQTAGSSTISATPLGTLPASGLSAQTATLVKTGTVSALPIADLYVSTPADAINAGTIPTAVTAQVPENTTNVVVTVDDTTINPAGTRLRFSAYLTAGGTLNGAAATLGAPQYIDVTTDAKKQATMNLTIGGAGVLNNSTLVVTQVNVANGSISNAGKITVAWKAAAVQANSIVPTPRGNIVAKVGASSTVAVQVDDSFGVPMSGWTVRSYRTSVGSANLLSSGTTNAAGLASVTVSPLATTIANQSETYRFTAQAPVNGTEITSSFTLTVTYTANGEITSLSVSNSGTGASVCTNLSCTLTTIPVVNVPSSGVISGTASTRAYTIATATYGGTGTNMATFTPNAAPDNAVVITVPEGVKVSATSPAATLTAWSGGAQTATVADNTPVYVWATKTGTHDIVFTSGGLTVTAKLKVENVAADAYNIALEAPKELRTGAFGTFSMKVTDAFGNPVGGTATTVGTVKLTVEGQAVFGGFASTVDAAGTNTSGVYTNNLVASQEAGSAVITAVPSTGNTATAWVTGYIRPTGFPAPVTSATATVVIGSASSKTITITGSRTTVSGKPGIQIDGVVTGIEDGKTVIPYFRFPGETTFAEGSARPVITDGSFTWQRKTGKKFYAYVTSDDGATTSNRVIIPAN